MQALYIQYGPLIFLSHDLVYLELHSVTSLYFDKGIYKATVIILYVLIPIFLHEDGVTVSMKCKVTMVIRSKPLGTL